MKPDYINAIFEGGGAFLLLMNVRRLYLDKKLAGVALAPTIWFNVWGAWNLYYYAELNQPLSWTAGVAVFLVNTTWVSMAVYYSSRDKKKVEEKLRAVELRYLEGEPKPISLKLSDGRIFRSDIFGVTWYEFPALVRPSIAFEMFLDDEERRLRKYGIERGWEYEGGTRNCTLLTQEDLDAGSWGIGKG